MSAEIASRAGANSRNGSTSPLSLLAAEWGKVRRTWVLPLTVLGPLGVTLMGIIYLLFEHDMVHKAVAEGAAPWQVLMSQMGYVQVFALMLGTALLASMLPDIDHRSATWKQVLALPVGRGSVYLAKWGLLVTLLAVASVLCSAGLAAIWVWQGFGPLPMKELALAAALPLLGVLPLTALQLGLSTWLKNQAVPLVVGITATMFGMAAARMSVAIPLALPIYGELIAIGAESGIATFAAWSAGWTSVFLAGGLLVVSRRDVA